LWVIESETERVRDAAPLVDSALVQYLRIADIDCILPSCQCGGRRVSEPSAKPLDATELFGIDFSQDRLAHNLAAYRDVLGEIRKLRELDLADVHPVVVFDVGAAFLGGKP
jgi:hypothetical protein